MKIKILILTLSLLLANMQQSYAAAAERETSYRRGPSLCVRLAMAGAAIFSMASGASATEIDSDSTLRGSLRKEDHSGGVLKPANEDRFLGMEAEVKVPVYVKAMVAGSDAEFIMGLVDRNGEATGFSEHAGGGRSHLLREDELHMTLDQIHVHRENIGNHNKKIMASLCEYFWQIYEKDFEYDSASSSFGNFVVIEVESKNDISILPPHPHVSIYRNTDEERREGFLDAFLKPIKRDLSDRPIRFDRITLEEEIARDVGDRMVHYPKSDTVNHKICDKISSE